MVRGSLPLGRFFGVEVRLHWSFPLLFGAALLWGLTATGYALRGFGVFAALCAAVLVRETARTLAAVAAGLRPRILFLLPFGGVIGFEPTPALRGWRRGRLFIAAAPLANVLAGLVLLGISYGGAPGVQLGEQPWISPAHVLRTFVWMQFILAVVNLLPAAALPTRQMLRLRRGAGLQAAAETTTESASTGGSPVPATPMVKAAAFSLVSGLAMAMLLAGIFTANIWLVVLGGFTLLLAQLRSQAVTSAGAGAGSPDSGIRVEQVMCTDFVTLSSSETVGSALERSAAVAQDVFPVLRGDRLVGSVTRQALQAQLRRGGDGYVQGMMTRTLKPTRADEPLSVALGRANTAGSAECVPVVDGFEGPLGGRVLGVLTPQTVNRAVDQLRANRLRDARP